MHIRFCLYKYFIACKLAFNKMKIATPVAMYLADMVILLYD